MKKLLYIPLLMTALTTNAATFTVSNTNDAGTGSLREAIDNANSAGGADTIDFSIGGTINLATGLANISDQVFIDGYSATGYTIGTPSLIIIGAVGENIFRFNGSGSNSTVRGIDFRGGVSQILLSGSSGLTIQGNWFGANSSYGDFGVRLQSGSSGNIIGGTSLQERNVIFGAIRDGIHLRGESNDNVISGNYIGLANDGITVGSLEYCIILNESHNNTIGGMTFAHRNIVGGASRDLINIADASDGTIVKANFIGLAADGSTTVGSGRHGLWFGDGATNGIVGGTTLPERNFAAGNANNGYSVNNASGIIFINNYSGVDSTGQQTRGNGWSGLSFWNGANCSASDNLFSGNTNEGIWMGDSDDLTFTGNIIGLNADGSTIIANGLQGIAVNNSTNITIGGDASGDGNVISGNGNQGIRAENSPAVIIKGNIVGLSADGLSDLGNQDHGIEIRSNSDGSIIGGPTDLERNIISGNGKTGLETEANTLTIENNYIGTDITGTSLIGNSQNGVRLLNRTGHNVLDNVIAGNVGRGVSMENADNSTFNNNTISDNGSDGIRLFSSSSDNTFTNNIFERNMNGLFIEDNGSDGNLVSQNSFSCNSNKAINLNGTDAVGVGNNNKPTPVINNVSPIGNLNGSAEPNDIIEIYTPGTCNSLGTCEGGQKMQGFVYVTTVIADGSGNWSYVSTMTAQNYTVTATTPTLNNTSEFAICSCTNPTFTVDVIDADNCEADNGSLLITGSGSDPIVAGVNYNVTYTNTESSVIGPVLYTATSGDVIEINNLLSGGYSDIIISSETCETTDSGPYTIGGEAFDPGILVISDTAVCSDEGALLTLQGGNGLIVTWMDSTEIQGVWDDVSPGLATTSASHIADVSYDDTPVYFKGYVTDGVCTGFTNEMVVTVDSCLPDPMIWIPTGFSPNNDGNNDGWQIKDIERFNDYKIEVYNRWGSLVYESNAPYTPWDGTRNGQQLPAATYYFVVQVFDTNESFSGPVSIVP